MPTYRYRRANGSEPVDVVAASCEIAQSGIAVFHDVTEENGERLGRTVEVRRVRMANDGEAPKRLDEGGVELGLQELRRARKLERQRLEALLRTRDVDPPVVTPKRLDALARAREVELRLDSASSRVDER